VALGDKVGLLTGEFDLFDPAVAGCDKVESQLLVFCVLSLVFGPGVACDW